MEETKLKQLRNAGFKKFSILCFKINYSLLENVFALHTFFWDHVNQSHNQNIWNIIKSKKMPRKWNYLGLAVATRADLYKNGVEPQENAYEGGGETIQEDAWMRTCARRRE